jgi:hypothetical protein
VQGLITVGSGQLSAYRVNYQVHSLQGQSAKQYILRFGNNRRRKRDAPVFPRNVFHEVSHTISYFTIP